MPNIVQEGIDVAEIHPIITIVIPVMDEADNVEPLVGRIAKSVAGYETEVLYVDDSKDTKTAKAVKRAASEFNGDGFKVGVFHRKGTNRWGGLSGAVTDGIERAKGDKVIVMDGDLQHPPEIIPDMIAAGSSSDLVVASRYCENGSSSGLEGAIRHLVSRGSTLLAKMFFPFRLRNVSDPMTGFFMIKRQDIVISRLHPKGFKILLEIIASHRELSVSEVPMEFGERTAGESHGTLKQGLEYLSQLVILRFGYPLETFRRLPKVVQFGAIGGSVFFVGMALLYGLVEWAHWPPLAANALQLAVTFWLNYLLNRKITWRERNVSRLAAHKFLFSRGVTTVMNYALFAWMITQQFNFEAFDRSFSFSINYLAANVISLLVIMALNFVISDRWAFAERKDTSELAHVSKGLFGKLSTINLLLLLMIVVIDFGIGYNAVLTLTLIMTLVGLMLFIQSSVEVWRIIYAYRKPEGVDRLKFPAPQKPKEKFCLIVPARHESQVLERTLTQLAKQTHSDFKIISVICEDDEDTLAVAKRVEQSKGRVEVMVYPLPKNSRPSKPKQMNYVLENINGRGFSVIGVIDAEDIVHPELLERIDSAFRDKKISIVQGGVQLMNHDSSWFSLHNVLEYYRWFNSTMSFQADKNFMPLGGNTLFVREKLLRRAGGWPETLTEDCSLGVLLSTKYKSRTAVYYEPRLATREETPDSLASLFKQRVRWNQGFYHEWRKGVWNDLPDRRQRFLADYILLSPVLLAVVSFFVPLSILGILFLEAPVGLVMLMYLPFIPLSMQLAFNAILLNDFGKLFNRKVKIKHYLILISTQIIYQMVLNLAAFWAVVRELRGDQSWYKTPHSGKHHVDLELMPVGPASANVSFIKEGADVGSI